ncbi:MAG: CARDB domain-containing protein, partial [Candidatus Margulisbacteria bacterium]|nr:CARDB domain-containing protein [Candidatus Margulisiibacteriota bacterium]
TTTTTTTIPSNANCHLKIINQDDDSYANVYYALQKLGYTTPYYSIAVNVGQTVTTPQIPVQAGEWRSILKWTDPDKGTEDIYTDGGYVTVGVGEDHEFTKYIPVYPTATSTTTTSTTTTTLLTGGTINLTVKNVNSSNTAGARVDRHNNSSWGYLDTRTSNYSGVASWSGIAAGTYMFKVWSNNEYWGYKPDVAVAAGGTTASTFTRYMPYGESVTSSRATYNAGEQGTINVKVKNNATFSNSVKVELILDRSQSAPYDHVATSEIQSLAAGSAATFTFNFTAAQSGTYYRALKVYTNVSSTYTLTDSWAFGSLDALQVNLPTTEACGYLKFSYNASSTFDQVKIYLDGSLKRTEDRSVFSGVNRQVEFNLMLYGNGSHVLKLEGWKDGAKNVELSRNFNLDNRTKIFLVGPSSKIQYPFQQDVFLEFHNIESYSLVVRQPTNYNPRHKISLIEEKLLQPIDSQIGYEYELPLKNYYFQYGTVSHKSNYLTLGVEDICGDLHDNGSVTLLPPFLPPPSSLTDVDIKILALYKTATLGEVKQGFGSSEDERLEMADKLLSLFSKLDKLKDLPDKVEVLANVGEVTLDDYYLIKANKYNNQYFLDAVGQIIKTDKTIKYTLEIADLEPLFKIETVKGKQKVVNTYNFDEFLLMLENGYEENMGKGIGYVDAVVDVKGDDFAITMKNRQLVRRSMDVFDSTVGMDGTSSISSSLDRVGYAKQSIEVKKKIKIADIDIKTNNKTIRNVGKAAEYVGLIMDLLSIYEVKELVERGELREATEKLAQIVGGTAGGAGGTVIGAGGGPAGSIVGAATGGYIGSEAAGGGVHYLLFGPESVRKISIYGGQKANFLFNFDNSGSYSHKFKITLNCPQSDDLTACYQDGTGEFTLAPGEHKEVNVWLAFSTVNVTQTHSFDLEVSMDDGQETWPVPAEVEVKSNISIPTCPEMPVTPSLYYDPETHSYKYYCPSHSIEGIWESYEYNNQMMKINLTAPDVNITWPGVPYYVPNYNLSAIKVEKSGSLIDLVVPNSGDTKILANYPSVITINNYSSNYCTIQHNGTTVYENGGVVEGYETLISNVNWDQTNDSLTFNVSHWDNYTIISDPSIVGPHIKSVLFNGKKIVTEDYVPRQPLIEVELEDKTSGIVSCGIEIRKASDNTVVFSAASAMSAMSAGGAKASLAVSEPLGEGSYFARVTVTDAAGNVSTYDTPVFRASSFFGMSALSGPNPFSPNGDGTADTTKITYQLSADAKIKIRLVDLSGRLIRHWDYEPGVVNKSTIGYNAVEWDGSDENGATVANGLYLCYVLAEAGGEVKKARLQIAVLK